MDIWDYDRKTGVLIGQSVADPNPEEPGAWLIPAFATAVRPPTVPEGCVAIFNGGLSAVGEWRVELDAGQISGLGLKECAALSALIKSYIEDREDHDKARITHVLEEMIDRASDEKAVRDEVKSLVRALIYGKSVN